MNPESSFRRRRFAMFRERLHVTSDTTILDIGGHFTTWIGSGLENCVTLVNLHVLDYCPPPFRRIEADACDLAQFKDGAFDVVFSNSLIEHVGDVSRQRMMAEEVRRLGRSYWVQTPYRHFPIESHTCFPGFQYLPRGIQVPIAKRWPFSFAYRHGLDPLEAVDRTWLLDGRTCQMLFPDGDLIWEWAFGFPKSIVMCRQRSR